MTLNQSTVAPSRIKIKLLFSLSVSVGLLLWLYQSVDWGIVSQHLGAVNYYYLLPTTVVFIISCALRAERWRYFFPEFGALKFKDLFNCLMLGNFATFVLPLRAGEFVRPYLMTRYSRYSFSTSFVSIVVERFFDLSVVLLSFGGMLLFLDGIPDWAYRGATILTVMAVGILIFMILGAVFPKKIIAVVEWFFKFLPWPKLQSLVNKFLGDLLEGVVVLKSITNLGRVILYSILLWGSIFLLFYLFLLMVNIPPSFLLAVSISVVVALAIAAPSAPGFLGVFQVGCIGGFAIFGIDQEIAVTYSIVNHLFQFVLVIGYGAFLLLKYNLNLAALTYRPVNC